MMNKKAIAAFAAGATLLAGFAMATPAFAADKTEAPKKEAEKELTGLEKAQKAVKDAQTKADEAAAAVKTAEEAATKASTAWEAAKNNVPAKGVESKDGNRTYVAKDEAMTEQERTTASEFLKKQADVKTKADAVTAAKATAADAAAKLTAAQTALANYKDPVKPADPSDSDLSGALVRTSGNFDKANGDLQKAYSKYEAAYLDVQAAQAKADDAKAAYDKYVHSHTDMTKAEQVEARLLQKASENAATELTDAKLAAGKAKGEFNKAFSAAHDAWAKYAGVYKAAKAKNASLVAGYALPSDVEPVDANYVPGVSHVTPGSVKPGYAGKPGAAKPGQAGANGAAAGAKTTVVEKKKDGGKKLPGTGVGVTLTALAATMLAGMGAAVRKARH